MDDSAKISHFEKARLAQNAYQREWRRKNKDKVREINERYWAKRIMHQSNTDAGLEMRVEEATEVEQKADIETEPELDLESVSLAGTIGSRVREVRAKHGESQKDLAEALGFKNQQSVGYVENAIRKPSIEMMRSIAARYNVSLDYFFGLSNDPRKMRTAVDDLGLSMDAVENLQRMNEAGMKDELSFISEMICNQYFRRKT